MREYQAIENQIRSFGQTPSQLLMEPHPPRSSAMHLVYENPMSETLLARFLTGFVLIWCLVSADVQLRYGGCVHVDEVSVKRGRRSFVGQHLPPVTSALCRLRPRQFAIRSQQVESCLRRYIYQIKSYIKISFISNCLDWCSRSASGNNSGYVDNAQAVLANLPLSMDPVLCKLFAHSSFFFWLEWNLSWSNEYFSGSYQIATVTSQSGFLARRHLGDNFSQKVRMRSNCFITTVDSRFLMACGFWDNSFRVFTTDTGMLTFFFTSYRDYFNVNILSLDFYS